MLLAAFLSTFAIALAGDLFPSASRVFFNYVSRVRQGRSCKANYFKANDDVATAKQTNVLAASLASKPAAKGIAVFVALTFPSRACKR